LNILKQHRHAKLWFKFADRCLDGVGKFFALVSPLRWFVVTQVPQGKTLSKAQKAFTSALFVNAGIYDQAMEPRGELRLTAKLIYRGDQLQKNLLRDVACGRLVT